MASELLDKCRDSGFTPGARHVPELLELWRSSERGERKAVASALGRGDATIAEALRREWAQAEGAEQAMRLRALGRVHRRTPLAGFEDEVLAHLRESAPMVQREAARVLAKLDVDDAARFEDALLAACAPAALPELKAFVDALGRVGGTRGRALLPDLDEGDDDLQRRVEEALALIDRRAGRAVPGRILDDQPLPASISAVLRYRAGVAGVVREQFGASNRLTPVSETSATLPWTGTLAGLLAPRSALDAGLSFPLSPGDDLPARLVATLQAPELVAALRAWTEGPIRFRLSFPDGGRRRAVIWAVARALSRADAVLLNDSRDARWSVEVDEARDEVLCLPRHDPRFGYRVADVRAASHPTLAATLAWLGAPKPGERVWDPFCGSAGELIECSLLQPDLELWGTDTDEAALAAARANVEAAHLDPARVHLSRADARTATVTAADLIVTNPPMGRRIARDGSLRPLLKSFVEHSASVLVPGGRLVWVTPLPEFTAEVAIDRGLRSDELGTFDMGGFTVGLQRLVRC